MHIRFIKDYKCYTKGTIIKVNAVFARRFVNDGYAVQIASSHRLGDLYVAPIILPEEFIGRLHSDGETKHIGIFKKRFELAESSKRPIYSHMAGDYKRPIYTHVLSKEEYETNSIYDYGCNSNLVVDERREQEFCEYFNEEADENNWGDYTRLSLQDIRDLENKINRIYTKQNDGRDC